MGFILWLIIGGVAGWLASLVMKTDAQQNWIIDIIVGIVGGAIGGFVLDLLNLNLGNNSWLISLGTAFLGAVILLAVVKFVRRAL